MAMVTPVLSFTAEEVYRFLPKEEGMPESVMLLDWPQAKPEYVDRDLKDKWDALLVLRSELTKALELARQKLSPYMLMAELTRPYPLWGKTAWLNSSLYRKRLW